MLLRRRPRPAAYASAATLALLALSFALGPIDPIRYLRLLSELGGHEARSGFGLIGALMNAGLAPAVAEASALTLTLGLLTAACAHCRRTGDERVAFCAGIIASLLLTPVLWSHYLVLLSAALITLGVPRRWLITFALASWAIAPPHGVHLDTDLIEGVAASGAWLAVGVSLVVFAYAAVRPPGMLPNESELPRWPVLRPPRRRSRSVLSNRFEHTLKSSPWNREPRTSAGTAHQRMHRS